MSCHLCLTKINEKILLTKRSSFSEKAAFAVITCFMSTLFTKWLNIFYTYICLPSLDTFLLHAYLILLSSLFINFFGKSL